MTINKTCRIRRLAAAVAVGIGAVGVVGAGPASATTTGADSTADTKPANHQEAGSIAARGFMAGGQRGIPEFCALSTETNAINSLSNGDVTIACKDGVFTVQSFATGGGQSVNCIMVCFDTSVGQAPDPMTSSPPTNQSPAGRLAKHEFDFSPLPPAKPPVEPVGEQGPDLTDGETIL